MWNLMGPGARKHLLALVVLEAWCALLLQLPLDPTVELSSTVLGRTMDLSAVALFIYYPLITAQALRLLASAPGPQRNRSPSMLLLLLLLNAPLWWMLVTRLHALGVVVE